MKVSIFKIIVIMSFILSACSSPKKIQQDDEFAVEAATSSDGLQSAGDDLSLDDGLDVAASNSQPEAAKEAGNAELSLENELENLNNNKNEGKDTALNNNSTLENSNSGVGLDQSSNLNTGLDNPTPPAELNTPISTIDSPPVVESSINSDSENLEEAATFSPVKSEELVSATPSGSSNGEIATALTNVTNIQYIPNSDGGVISITSDKPITYSTRLNSVTNQFVIEAINTVIPSTLKRSLNTKDMSSSIGSVDIYRRTNSNITRFVVQLREGATNPMVQQEGNSLLVIGESSSTVAKSLEEEEEKKGIVLKSPHALEIENLYDEGIMSSDNLEEFLISNNKYYGKKISIQTSDMDLRDSLNLLSEESGVNMVFDEDVSGKVSLTLKDVPWDQAFIMILKTKKLGYKRQGKVLRIAKLETIKAEEDAAIQRKLSRKIEKPDPLIVKRFFIGYANITDISKSIGEFLTMTNAVESNNRAAAAASQGAAAPQQGSNASAGSSTTTAAIGRVLADARTSTIIVTETAENLKKVEKLIEALDIQPPQVLIEAKVVEAIENFTEELGFFFGAPGSDTSTNGAGFEIQPSVPGETATELDASFRWGQLDVLGTLNATIRMGERDNKVKILSAPRITVLSNQKANIFQGVQVPIVTRADDGSISTEMQDVGINLEATPQVSNENTIKLELKIDKKLQRAVTTAAIDTRTAETKMIVKSGSTAVIGGIFDSNNTAQSSGVPGLRSIPVIGSLFQGEAESKTKNELVIFITPTILKPVVGAGGVKSAYSEGSVEIK